MTEPIAGSATAGTRDRGLLGAFADWDVRPLMSVTLALAVGVVVGDIGFGIAILVAAVLFARPSTGAVAGTRPFRLVLLTGVVALVSGVFFGELLDFALNVQFSELLPINRIEITTVVAPVIAIVWALGLAVLLIKSLKAQGDSGIPLRHSIAHSTTIAGLLLILPWVLGQVGFLAGVVILPLAKRAKPVNERDEALLMMIALAAGVLLVTVGVEFLAAAVPPAPLGVIGLVLHGANVWLAVTPLAPK